MMVLLALTSLPRKAHVAAFPCQNGRVLTCGTLTSAVLYLQTYGARPLRRAVTAIVEDPLAEALLHNRVAAGQIAVVDRLDDGTITVSNCFESPPLCLTPAAHMGPEMTLGS